jgi:hypothetical protein
MPALRNAPVPKLGLRLHAQVPRLRARLEGVMKTAQQREEAFRMDFEALCEKHNATINVTDDGKPYGMHNGVATVTMEASWDGNGNQTEEYTEFNL